jgi:hypothetical protein
MKSIFLLKNVAFQSNLGEFQPQKNKVGPKTFIRCIFSELFCRMFARQGREERGGVRQDPSARLFQLVGPQHLVAGFAQARQTRHLLFFLNEEARNNIQSLFHFFKTTLFF